MAAPGPPFCLRRSVRTRPSSRRSDSGVPAQPPPSSIVQATAGWGRQRGLTAPWPTVAFAGECDDGLESRIHEPGFADPVARVDFELLCAVEAAGAAGEHFDYRGHIEPPINEVVGPAGLGPREVLVGGYAFANDDRFAFRAGREGGGSRLCHISILRPHGSTRRTAGLTTVFGSRTVPP